MIASILDCIFVFGLGSTPLKSFWAPVLSLEPESSGSVVGCCCWDTGTGDWLMNCGFFWGILNAFPLNKFAKIFCLLFSRSWLVCWLLVAVATRRLAALLPNWLKKPLKIPLPREDNKFMGLSAFWADCWLPAAWLSPPKLKRREVRPYIPQSRYFWVSKLLVSN